MRLLRQLMELENAYNKNEGPREKILEMTSVLRASSVPKKSLDSTFEAGPRAARSRGHARASFQSRLAEEVVPEGFRLKALFEFREPPEKRRQSFPMSKAEIPHCKQAEESSDDDRKSLPSGEVSVNRCFRFVRDNHEESSIKSEKKRPLSKINATSMRRWKSPNGALDVKVESCNGTDEGPSTAPEISPGKGNSGPANVIYRWTSAAPQDGQVATEDLFNLKGNAFDGVKSDGPERENCAQKKWKKQTKAELRKVTQEQELSWKVAEYAVDELGRRVEQLERYKTKLEDTLGRTRETSNADNSVKRQKEDLGDLPAGLYSLYCSPVYEEGKSGFLDNSPISTERKGSSAAGVDRCQSDIGTSPSRSDVSDDSEIQKLRDEIVYLRCELQRRDNEVAEDPTFKVRTPVEQEDAPPLNDIISQGTDTAAELNIQTEFVDGSFEELKTITIQETQNGSVEYCNGNVDVFQPSNKLSPRKGEVYKDDRGWVPSPDGETEDKSAALTLTDSDSRQAGQMDDQDGSVRQEEIFHSIDFNSESEGELRVLKTAVRKISRIFWDQEGKLKTFKSSHKNRGGNISQTENLRDFYLDMLKEMSHQLAQLSRDLQENTRSLEAAQSKSRTIRKLDPSQKDTKIVDSTTIESNIVQVAQELHTENGNTTPLTSNTFESGAKKFVTAVEERADNFMSDISTELKEALTAAEKKLEEQIDANLLLAEKLECTSQHFSKLQAEHAEEVERKDKRINRAQQLNLDLATDIAQAKSSLGELRSWYRSVVTNLERQLEEARKEAISVKDTLIILKGELIGKRDMVSSLEAIMKEQELQIEELKRRGQTAQDAATAKKRELTKNLEATTKEVEQQQQRLTDLIAINENIILFSRGKQEERTDLVYRKRRGVTCRKGVLLNLFLLQMKELTINAKSLQQSLDERSDAAAKLSAEALALSQEVLESRKEEEQYRLRCTTLKSKLEEVEYELQAKEASIEKLIHHLGKTIEGPDFISEEKEQLFQSLNKARDKKQSGDQVRQSKTIIQELEEKLNAMDAEVNEARLEMAQRKVKGLEALRESKQES